jgi:hypothetical protein
MFGTSDDIRMLTTFCQDVHLLLYFVFRRPEYTRWYPKYSGLVPPSIQQLWSREAPVDGRTTMCSESACQVARSWVNVGSFHTRLFGVVYVTCDDFHDGSEKRTASVRSTLAVLTCIWEKLNLNKEE